MKQNNWKQYWKPGVAAVLLTVAGLYYGFAGRSDEMISLGKIVSEIEMTTSVLETPEPDTDGLSVENMSVADESGPQLYYVHVCGEVKVPGVYALPEGSRIFEAVAAAGGLTELASETSLNQAEMIEDGMQIVIQNREEAVEQEKIQKELALGLVNLNTATREQLMTLPGIGAARAEAILQYREQSGGFRTVEEIMNVSGIKEAAYRKIKDRITI